MAWQLGREAALLGMAEPKARDWADVGSAERVARYAERVGTGRHIKVVRTPGRQAQG